MSKSPNPRMTRRKRWKGSHTKFLGQGTAEKRNRKEEEYLLLVLVCSGILHVVALACCAVCIACLVLLSLLEVLLFVFESLMLWVGIWISAHGHHLYILTDAVVWLHWDHLCILVQHIVLVKLWVRAHHAVGSHYVTLNSIIVGRTLCLTVVLFEFFFVWWGFWMDWLRVRSWSCA